MLVCCHRGRVNRCLDEMGVNYEPRPIPLGPQRRMRASGNVGSEAVGGKRSKGKTAAGVAGRGKAAKESAVRQTAVHLEGRKRKGADQGDR